MYIYSREIIKKKVSNYFFENESLSQEHQNFSFTKNQEHMKLKKIELTNAIWNIAIICCLVQLTACKKDIVTAPIDIYYEQIPGSKNHGPNGTWWGYNQSKIVRFENIVYMYVVDNQNIDNNPNPNASNPSKLVLYKKQGDNAWQKGSEFNTSRPGNILIDSEGIVHLIVFEPTYTQSTENGSYGKLKHYWFPNSNTGDISNFQQETIIDNDGVSQGETVNIRVGASIGKNDMLAVSFGLNKTHQFYYKEKNGIKWFMDFAGQYLNSDFYYPYVLVSESGVSILAIQDDWVGTNQPNLYQESYYFEKKNGVWTQESIINLQSHSLAQSRPQLVENSDLYQDENNQIHLVYQTRLNPSDEWQNTFFHATKTPTSWNTDEIFISDKNSNWMRMIEIEGEIYYLCSSWDKLYVKKGIEGEFSKLNVPKVKGMYIYLDSPRGGTNTNATYIDILMLNGSSNDYPNAKNYYVRIEKSEFAKLM